MSLVWKKNENDVIATNLTFLLTDPSILEEFEILEEEDLALELKHIEKFEVLEHFTDDHTDCYKVRFTIGGIGYIYDLMWIGDYSRLLYQSEISRDILETVLKRFLAYQILN